MRGEPQQNDRPERVNSLPLHLNKPPPPPPPSPPHSITSRLSTPLQLLGKQRSILPSGEKKNEAAPITIFRLPLHGEETDTQAEEEEEARLPSFINFSARPLRVDSIHLEQQFCLLLPLLLLGVFLHSFLCLNRLSLGAFFLPAAPGDIIIVAAVKYKTRASPT